MSLRDSPLNFLSGYMPGSGATPCPNLFTAASIQLGSVSVPIWLFSRPAKHVGLEVMLTPQLPKTTYADYREAKVLLYPTIH